MQVHIKEVWMLKLQFYFLSDVLQIEAEEFQDSDDSEIGYWSKGGERKPCESELFVVERSSLVLIDSVAKEFARTKPYLHSDK